VSASSGASPEETLALRLEPPNNPPSLDIPNELGGEKLFPLFQDIRDVYRCSDAERFKVN